MGNKENIKIIKFHFSIKSTKRLAKHRTEIIQGVYQHQTSIIPKPQGMVKEPRVIAHLEIKQV